MTQAPTPGPLWMMHVIGPDDIYPAPDHATAVEWCAALNASMPASDVLCVAVPAIWMGTPEAHAEGLSKAVEGWTSPRQRLAPTAPVEASGSVGLAASEIGAHIAKRDAEYEAALSDLTITPDASSLDEFGRSIFGALSDCPAMSLDKQADFVARALWTAVSTLRPQPSGEAREAVARIVDPETFALISHYSGIERFDGLTPEQREPDVFKGYPDLKSKRDAAYADADRIFSLIRPAPVASGGQHSSGEEAGCAEPQVGRAVYERIEKLLKTDPTGWERAYLCHLVESVEEVGGYDGPRLDDFPYRKAVAAFLKLRDESVGPGEADDGERLESADIILSLTAPVPAQDDDKLRALDVTEDEVAVLLEVMAYAGDEVANAGAANSLFLKAEALSVGLKSTAAQVNIPGKAGSCDQAARVLASSEGLK